MTKPTNTLPVVEAYEVPTTEPIHVDVAAVRAVALIEAADTLRRMAQREIEDTPVRNDDLDAIKDLISKYTEAAYSSGSNATGYATQIVEHLISGDLIIELESLRGAR